MATYLELKEQAERLMAQAEQLRQKETEDAINDVKAKIKAYGLTAEDLGLRAAAGAGRRSARAGGTAASAKYRGPDGKTWSGRGRKPQWVVDALKGGKKLDDLAA
ncbi:H-NS histone family protein [Ramlibacter tataouinensis]|nr:H-NS histone family protein [Ramlibacter tataouinensis]